MSLSTLLIATGFLGGLTAYSMFSAAVVSRLIARRMTWVPFTIAVHVAGSIAMKLLDIGTVALPRKPQLA